jgi:hypothetical protein
MFIEKPFDMIGEYNKNEYPEFDPREIINQFVIMDPEGKNGKALFPTPGLSLTNGTLLPGTGGCRKDYKFKNSFFVVVSDSIYRLDSSLNQSFIGNIETQTGHVGIVSNDTQVIFVDGVGGWVFDSTDDSFTKVVAAGFPSQPQDVRVLAGRAIVNFGGTKEVGYSDIGDFTSWDPLNFFNMTAYPDITIAIGTLNGRLFIMGERSTENWYDAGAPSLPFRRENPAYEFGCASPSSVASGFGVLVWLSKNIDGIGSVVATTGGRPIPVSTPAIDREFDSYDSVSDAKSFVYKNELGHVMYVINFTSANKSWMYDFNTKLWFKLETGESRYLGNDHVYFGTKHYVVDYKEPKVYEMSNCYDDDAGINIKRAIVSPVLFDKEYKDFTLNRLRVDLKQGTGLSTGDDEQPKLFLSVSDDGGVSYGSQITQDIGPIGRRKFKTEFHKLGWGSSKVLKLEHYNSTKFVFLGASVTMEVEDVGSR